MCNIISFIKRSVKHCFNGINQVFTLFTMTHSNEMTLFSIMFLKYMVNFPVFGNYSTFGNTRSHSMLEYFETIGILN